jgi:hypothetical protein
MATRRGHACIRPGPGTQHFRLVALFALFAFLTAVTPALTGCGSGSQLAGSGVRGVAQLLVDAGPGYEGKPEPTPSPLEGAVIVALSGGGEVAGRAVSDRSGLFEMSLAPGAYEIVPLNPKGSGAEMSSQMQRVDVFGGQFAPLTVKYYLALP